MRPRLPLLVAAALTSARAAGAQPAAPAVAPGSVVRVTAPAAGLRGDDAFTVLGTRADTLILRGAAAADSVVVPAAQVEALRVRGPRESRRAGSRRGARIGMALGVGATLAFLPGGVRAERQCRADGCWVSPLLALAVAGSAVTFVSTGVGALVGHAAPRYRWERVDPARLRVGAGLAPGGGAAVAVGVRF